MIALLVTVMLPSLSAVRVTTRKILCASNTRQVGLGMHMYADDFRGFVPSSRSLLPAGPSGEMRTLDADTLMLRHASVARANVTGDWDGLGLLFAGDYLRAGGVFYCPSHADEFTFERYATLFTTATVQTPEGVVAEVIGNYQYRGEGPSGERGLFDMPFDAAIVSDALGTGGWVNHRGGVNVLRAGLSVDWIGAAEGITGDVLLSMVLSGGDPSGDEAWRTLDGLKPNSSGPSPFEPGNR